jgi:hypothetical protein
MHLRRNIVRVFVILAVLCEAAVIFFLSRNIERAADQDKIPAWGTTLDVSILALGAPLFILLLGGAILWIHDKLRN